MWDLLLVNGTIITIDQDRRIIDNGFVAVQKDRIVAIGQMSELTDTGARKVIDCSDHVIMPGLVDA